MRSVTAWYRVEHAVAVPAPTVRPAPGLSRDPVATADPVRAGQHWRINAAVAAMNGVAKLVPA
jgi:hypothetical protein